MVLKPIIEQFSSSAEYKELQARLAGTTGAPLSIEGIAPSSFPLIIAAMFNDSPGQFIIVTRNTQRMQELHLDLSCMVDPDLLFSLPSWDTLPYEFVSPSETTERDRITALYRIIKGGPAIIVTTVESIMRVIPERNFFIKKGLTLEIGDDYPFDDIIEVLVSYGYSREARVEAFGHFAVKGGIIDIFLPSYDNPVRIDFFGDTLDSIREFDIGSQISHTKHQTVTIYPRKELVLLKSEREKLRSVLEKEYNKGTYFPDDIIGWIESGGIEKINGIEDLFPLVIGKTTLASYLNEKGRIVFADTPDLITQKIP